MVIVYNPIISCRKKLLPYINSDHAELKNVFPEGKINVTYKRGKSLRDLISPSMIPQVQAEPHSVVNVNLEDVTSSKTIWSARMKLRAQLPAKHIK